jgi:ABC-type polysaccharide/polyol phosphate export permease
MVSSNQEVVYSSKDENLNFLQIFLSLFQQLYYNRSQVFVTIKKDFKIKYQDTFLGLFWAIIIPVVPMGAYMMLASIKAFNSSAEMPYVFFIAIGMTLWMFMSKVMRQSLMAINSQKAILSKTNYPIIAVVFERIGEALSDTVIRVIAVVIIMFWYHVNTTMQGFFTGVLLLIPMFLFAISTGMILSILNTIVPDTIKIFDIAMRYGIFLSSVIFPFPDEGALGAINQFNVFNTYINAFRNAIYHDEIYSTSLLLYSIVFTVLLTLTAAKLVHYMNYRIRAYI